MQFFWLYMDELIGKGLAIWTIVQLLMYMSATLVPLALPLSILLASIMTFGSLGENFELVAIKSSGISLIRFLRPMFLFITFVAAMAFLFNNYVIPVANLKSLSLLYDVRNSKPTLNIRPDEFNSEIQGYSIRVGSKDKDGKTIHDIIIYDQNDMVGNNNVIIAKSGEMMPTMDKQSLVFRLKDGWRYTEGVTRGQRDNTQTRMHFETWDKVFDLSSFRFTRTNESLFKGAYQMMDVKQLTENMDSLKKSGKRTFASITGYMSQYVTLDNNKKEAKALDTKIPKSTGRTGRYDSSFIETLPDTLRTQVAQMVSNNIRNFKSQIDINAIEKKLDKENYLKFDVEWHRKFMLSFACLLLFLIGAPLGAIIRKGGIGLPLVFAVSFFIAFHILNITGEKLAKSESVPVWVGMWMSSGILLPVALWLTMAARNDSQVLSKETYFRAWQALKRLLGFKPAVHGAESA